MAGLAIAVAIVLSGTVQDQNDGGGSAVAAALAVGADGRDPARHRAAREPGHGPRDRRAQDPTRSRPAQDPEPRRPGAGAQEPGTATTSRPGTTARPPVPPPGADPLPPVPDPVVLDVPRDDLRQRFRPVSPLEGLWTLRRAVFAGGRELSGASAVGWLSIHERHLLVHLRLAAPAPPGAGVQPGPPFLQAGVHRWSADGTQLFTTAIAAHRGSGRRVRHDRPGATERRRYSLSGATLRLSRSDVEYLEFVRVE